MAAPVGNQFWNIISASQAKAYLKPGYKDEDHFCDTLEINMPLICSRVFDQDYISHRREFPLPTSHSIKPKIDLLIQGSKEVIAVETKVPKKRGQSGVYQLLKYKTLADQLGVKIDRLALFTTDLAIYDYAIIKKFNLPVEVYFISNQKVMKYAER